jgi:hypothetical protein
LEEELTIDDLAEAGQNSDPAGSGSWLFCIDASAIHSHAEVAETNFCSYVAEAGQNSGPAGSGRWLFCIDASTIHGHMEVAELTFINMLQRQDETLVQLGLAILYRH